MSENINLLIRTDKDSLKLRNRIKILNFAAITSLSIVILISLGIFIAIQVVNPEPIRKEQADVLGKISQFQTKQAKLFILNNRVENIDGILKTRKNLAKTMSSLLAKIPNNLSIDNFEIDGNTVIIVGQSKSLVTVGEFINILTDMVRKKEIIKSLTLSSLILDQAKNAYQVSVKSKL